MDEYAHVFVISDLHISAAIGLFRSGDVLARSLKRIGEVPGPVAVVINGDFLDFLVGRAPGVYFKAELALAELDRMAEVWPQVFAAFKALPRPGHQLVITVGNHDLELMQSDVRDRLEALVGQVKWGMGEGEDRGRFVCTVGGRVVKCIHGNGEDRWNVYDLNAVRSRIDDDKEPAPCAGTRLVVDILNEAKAVDPFLEVLKPEDYQLLCIAVARQKRLYTKVPLLADAGLRQKLTPLRFLAGGAASQYAPPADQLRVELAEGRVQSEEVGEDRLGLGGLLFDSLLGRNLSEELYEAVRNWQEREGQDIYELRGADPILSARTDNAGADILVAGHTHLARCLRNGSGIFLNSGTWTNLMRIPPLQLRSALAFKEVERARDSASQSGSLDPLRPYLFEPRNCIHIQATGGGVVAELQETRDDGSPRVMSSEILASLSGGKSHA